MYRTILNKIVLPLLLLILSVYRINAQSDSTETKDGGLSISGYADVYYTYNLNNPAYTGNISRSAQPLGFDVQNPGRIFDIKHNSASLGLILTKFQYTKKKSDLVLDLCYGPNAELGNFGNVFGSMIAIKQAYMTYRATDKLSFTAGQFGTHVGYELIDAPLNANYSLSYLFGNGPFYHTGLKASYSFSDNVKLMAGVVNGWDGLFAFNKKKSAIAQLYLKPVKGWDVYINYIGGDNKNGYSFPTAGSPESPIAASKKTPSHLFDLTTTYQVNDKLKLGLNAAYGFGKLVVDTTKSGGYDDATWYGAALYVNYFITNKFSLFFRAEHFADPDGVRYVGSAPGPGLTGLGAGSFNEFTLTGDVALDGGSLHLKPEFRIDIAEKKVYTLNPEASKPTPTKVQPTLGLAAIYTF